MNADAAQIARDKRAREAETSYEGPHVLFTAAELARIRQVLTEGLFIEAEIDDAIMRKLDRRLSSSPKFRTPHE